MLKDIREFIFESYYERIGLLKMITIIHRKKQKKKFVLFATNLTKIPEPTKAKEHSELFKRIKAKNPKNNDTKFVTVNILNLLFIYETL